MSRNSEQKNRLRWARADAGWCVGCGKCPPIEGQRRCPICARKNRGRRNIERNPKPAAIIVDLGPPIWDLLPDYSAGIRAAVREAS
jgi:hypothetical protein